ncbi:MAG: hypothetical protein WC584_01750 [Candidatus Pacearchaeota archaeon]
MGFYLAEKCVEDSSIVEKRSIICVSESGVFFTRGQTKDIFELDEEGNPFCKTDKGYHINKLSERRTEKLGNPSLRWGYLNKGKRFMSYRN